MKEADAVILDGLTKRYGDRTVVHGVTLALAAGERLALLGHNGAGKTTLMKMMLGLVRPDGGEVRVLGRDPAEAAADVRRSVGFLPESVAFYEAMTGWETLRFYARVKRRPAEECRALLARVGLADAAGRRVGTYSKGMRQRLGLAQALLGAPRLLLLDEPTTGLDPELRQSFYGIIAELKAQGTAVLLSSHLLTELEERTDHIAIMNQGHLVGLGTLGDLREQAGLPVRFRLRVVNGDAATVADHFGALVFERVPGEVGPACPARDKMDVLRAIAGLGDRVADVEVVPPSLDDVYASFTGRPLSEGAPA
ncbi:ABC transporter ATP-binding protein [Azospirillum canadense]|uniref:ABC transporter ATP-binding protein n=1 Tax=Azospirillum canadense TaxID=403962 RepID=UPI0022276984|nr:ABC transporter ATP-binding protein [Azospirillum canadense]MCW2239048.1 Cu-processing system ATP-binding protein [Azospirillum canadense]